MKKLLLLSLFSILLTSITYSQGTNCATADPFCTGTTYTFPNNTGIPDQGTYQCLGTTPNPAWYYLQIANSGNIDIHITQTSNGGSGIDVDFIMWGPFSSTSNACATITTATAAVDCSYSTAAQEDANIPNAITGEYYMLMLTNYADVAGTISFSQTGGTGSTDCSVLCGPPLITMGTTQTITCTTTSVSLSASSSVSGVTYSWAGPGGFTSGAPNPTATVAGTYTVTVTDPANSGCPATATQVVNTNNTPPNLVVGTTQSITCLVSSVSLNANSTTSGVTYSWTGPGITGGATSGTPTANAAGTYTVVVTDPSNGCTSTATQDVILNNSVPNLTMGSTQNIDCITTTASLSATTSTGGVTYNWSGAGITSGGTTSTPTVNAAGTYSVTITDPSNGCTASGTQDVTSSGAFPNITTGAQDTLTCATLSLNLSGSSTTPNVTYSWSGPGIVSGNTTSSPTVNAIGTYTVTITDPSNGCTSSATQTIVSNTTAPNVVTGTSQTLTCVVTSTSLSANSSTPGAIYSWSGAGIVSGGTSATPSVNAAGTYTVTITDPANGCTVTASQVVNSNTTAPTAVAGNDVVLACNASSLNLNGTGSSTGAGMTYSWSTSNGSITGGANTLTPSVSQAGSYTVTVTNTANGCTASDVVDVTPEPLPIASFTASPSSGIVPLTVDFTNTSSNSTNYAWSFDNGQTSILNDPSTIYSTPGVYTVILLASNANGCVDTATLDITVLEPSGLVVPNVFTPNGDGANDFFKPVLAEGLSSFSMTVYDRWGLKMSEVTNESIGWDGNSKNGSLAPDGTYYYLVDAKGADGKEYKFTGYVSLIRAK